MRKLKLAAAKILGFSGNDVYLLKSVRHHFWIPKVFPVSTGKIPVRRLELAEIKPTGPADVALCERLIAAYRKARSEPDIRANVSPMWESNLNTKQAPLSAALAAGDPSRLADLLATMLRSSVVVGIDSGDLYTGGNWKVHSLKLLDDLVSLAEQLGIARTESGQASMGHAFAGGTEKLVEEIEEHLGITLALPEVGAPFGLRVGHRLISLSTPEYAYVAWRIRESLRLFRRTEGPAALLEIGAGFGGTAYLAHRLLDSELDTYTIIDLPEMNCMQGYFLAQSLGADGVAFYGEDRPSARTRVLPPQALDRHPKVDIVINQNSLPEIPLEAGLGYGSWIRENCRDFFYSYNHESIDPSGECAVMPVADLMRELGGMSRLTRNPSWLRPGYVEEIWVPVQAR